MRPFELGNAGEQLAFDLVARALKRPLARPSQAAPQRLARKRLERVWAGTATPGETAAELRDNLIRSNELPHLPRALGGAG
jgi:hypothetical protein